VHRRWESKYTLTNMSLIYMELNLISLRIVLDVNFMNKK